MVPADDLVIKGSSEWFQKLSVHISGEGKREKVAEENETEILFIYQPLLFISPSMRGSWHR